MQGHMLYIKYVRREHNPANKYNQADCYMSGIFSLLQKYKHKQSEAKTDVDQPQTEERIRDKQMLSEKIILVSKYQVYSY